MKQFDYFSPTKMVFGIGKFDELGTLASTYGRRALLVHMPIFDAVRSHFERAEHLLTEQGIEVVHFDKVQANPTVEMVQAGHRKAKKTDVNFVIAMGGGSVIDTAKLISLLIGEEALDFGRYFEDFTNPFRIYPPMKQKLPLIAVPTTSGTGSQFTQAAVVTDGTHKNTIFHNENFPSVALIDPTLMLTLPKKLTAITAFDAFSHAFESYLSPRCSYMVEKLALDAISLITENLPEVLDNLNNLEAREQLALADSFAGMALANGGAGAPHPLGEILAGLCPTIPHGVSLAVFYPEYMAQQHKRNPQKVDRVLKLMSEAYNSEDYGNHVGSARATCKGFLQKIGLNVHLRNLEISKETVEKIEKQLIFDLPLSSKQEMVEILRKSW